MPAVSREGDTLTTDLLKSIENKDDLIKETNYLTEDVLDYIRDNTKSCRTEIGKQFYRSVKGYAYTWPTLLSFMEKK